ncbi:MAG: outer membrane lipoprotein carrier protein LolA [Deltaproteobacteria bacterium]|nr:outer membrane lipoprotein carrier protein LolA [Deltaproteobacteria bacterium]
MPEPLRRSVSLLVALLSVAAAPAIEEVAPPAVPAPLALIARKMQEIKSLTAHLRQTKEIKILAEVAQSEGTLTFVRPRRLAIDLEGPGGTTMVIDGDQMTLVFKAVRRTERKSLAKDPRARAVAEHLFLLLEAEPQALQQTYDLKVVSDKPLAVRLVPRAAVLAKILRQVQARFDPRGFVDLLVVEETNGDVTRWQFEDTHINPPVPETAFAVPP